MSNEESVGLRIGFSRSIWTSDDEEDAVACFEGEIFADAADDGDKRKVGLFDVFTFNAELACNDGRPLREVLDYQAETAPYAQLYTDDGDLVPNVCRALKLAQYDVPTLPGLLILHRLELLPEWRGQELGLACMRSAIRNFGLGCRLVAIKPFPLQFEASVKDRGTNGAPWQEQLRLQDFPKSKRDCTSRLRRYYSRLGFNHVKGTDLMVLDLERRLPNFESID